MADSEIEILSNLAALTRQDVEGILNRNRIYTKFHRALYLFASRRWQFSDNFKGNHNTNTFLPDFFHVETFTTNGTGGAAMVLVAELPH